MPRGSQDLLQSFLGLRDQTLQFFPVKLDLQNRRAQVPQTVITKLAYWLVSGYELRDQSSTPTHSAPAKKLSGYDRASEKAER